MTKDQETESFVNILLQANLNKSSRYYKEYLTWLIKSPILARDSKKSLVDWHKAKLGPQSFCWTSYKRFHVWDIGIIRLYVSSGVGVSVEVKAGTKLPTAWKHFLAYKRKMEK